MQSPIVSFVEGGGTSANTSPNRNSGSPLEKLAALKDTLDHLYTITTERSYYTNILKEC